MPSEQAFSENFNTDGPNFFSLKLKENSKLTRTKTINFIKICSNCFYVYNFLHEKLEALETKMLKTSFLGKDKEWVHREKRFAHTFNESLKSKHMIMIKSKPFTNSASLHTNISNLKKDEEIKADTFSLDTDREILRTSREENYEKKEYSFLNRRDLASHVLNLGFSTNFKSIMPNITKTSTQSISFINFNNKVNFYEILQGKNMSISTLSPSLSKKMTMTMDNVKGNELFRKSSVSFIFLIYKLCNIE